MTSVFNSHLFSNFDRACLLFGADTSFVELVFSNLLICYLFFFSVGSSPLVRSLFYHS